MAIALLVFCSGDSPTEPVTQEGVLAPGVPRGGGGRGPAVGRVSMRQVVEAAGIEPLFLTNPNAMMANDFGFYGVKTHELPRRSFSPGVPSSPLVSSPALETFWRRDSAGN